MFSLTSSRHHQLSLIFGGYVRLEFLILTINAEYYGKLFVLVSFEFLAMDSLHSVKFLGWCIFTVILAKAVATKFSGGGGGGGSGFINTPKHTYVPSNFSFPSDLGHFILKMLENATFQGLF